MARYKPYEKYKDSGVEWIGEIPEHWEMSRLKRVTELVIQKASNDDLDKPYIGLENIESWTGQYNSVEEFEDTSANLFSPGMVLFGKLRPYLAKSIKVDFWGRCSSELLTLDLKKIVSCFLHYLLLMKGFISEVNSSTYGVKMPRASWEFIGNMFMAIPPESEQQAIANFLDQKTSELDGLIADKEKLVTLLQEYRQSIISEAVTKGLNPDVKMKDSGVEWIGEIPEHWDVSNLGYKSRMIVPMRDKPVNLTGDVPWIRIEDFKGKYISESVSGQGVETELINKMNLKVYPNGTVLCSCSCTMGRTAIVASPLISNQTFIGIVPSQQLCSSYLYYLMQVCSEWLQYLGQGAIQQYLSRHDFEHLKVTFPPISEQQAIADYLDQKTTEINDLISGIQKSIAQLKSYRQSLISEAVTGKIDVRGVI